MTTDTAVDDWHWVDVEGTRRHASRQEILTLLGGGRIARHTLVWRKGWAQWMRASQVAELAQAYPGGVAAAFIAPKVDLHVVDPPPIPAGSMGAQTTVVAATNSAVPARSPMQHRPAAITPVPPAAQRPALQRRPAMQTLIGEDEPATQTGTLRPPAAVPPPPRAIPSLSRMEAVVPEPEREGAPATPFPARRIDIVDPPRLYTEPTATNDSTGTQVRSAPATQVTAAPEPGLVSTQGDGIVRPALAEATLASATHEQQPASQAPVPLEKTDRAAPESPASDASAFDSSGPSTPAAADPVARSGLSRALAPYVVLGVAAGLLGAIAVGLWSQRRQTRPTAKRTTPVVAMAKPSAPPEGPCVLAHSAQRLSPAAVLSVPLNVGTDPSTGNAALGFADSARGAMGIVVDPASLMVGHVFREPSSTSTLEVTPLSASGRLEFAVTRADGELAWSHPVDTARRFVVGFRDQDFESVLQGTHETVWRDVGAGKLTNPRIATVASVGHAVTFRSGGQQGRILFGWLTDDGRPKTALEPLAVEGLVGTPTLAANDRGVLVAFAARSHAKEPWHVELAPADFGAAPARSMPFALPPGGAGQEAISPVAAGLPGGRWLLQWTEGPPRHRDVRVQTLSSTLKPLGGPVTVSPKDSNAGQGGVWVHQATALAAFLVSSQHAHELWGATLTCP
ncbi:MAG: DUF4339 domain-containing protein [Polyangiaceae bacterium]|nr:DUF4339 domain-containing protein [Polyangiaceae bacterium]